MKLKKLLCLLLIGVFTLSFASCQKKPDGDTSSIDSQNAGRKVRVAVSILPEREFVRKVGGGNVEVITMIPPGNSPANYEPTPYELKLFEDADIYFAIGVPTESAHILKNVSDKVKVVMLNEAAKEEYDELTLDGERDVHIWLSPKRVKVMVDKIAEELSILDPQNKESYLKNAEDYKNELDDASTEIRRTLANLKNREIIVYHPFINYFADEFNLTAHALERNGREVYGAALTEMVDLAKNKKISTVFYQKEVSKQGALAFAEDIEGQAVELMPLAEYYVENLKNMAEKIKEADSK